MPYEPPSGWVEELDHPAEDAPLRLRFHISDRCPRVGDPHRLMAVDKPYSAVRCIRCARTHA